MSIKPRKGNGNTKSLKEVAIEATEVFYRLGLIDEKKYLDSKKAWN